MRTLVISDIHASLEGMDACLAVAKDKYDAVFNLGDVVGYGASPNEVVVKSIALGGLFGYKGTVLVVQGHSFANVRSSYDIFEPSRLYFFSPETGESLLNGAGTSVSS